MRTLVTSLIVLCMSGAAIAQQTDVPNERYSEIVSETMLLKAKADEAAALKAVSAQVGTPVAAGPSTPLMPMEPAPQVVGIFGPEHAQYALLQTADGRNEPVHNGETTQDKKWRVEFDASGKVRVLPAGRTH